MENQSERIAADKEEFDHCLYDYGENKIKPYAQRFLYKRSSHDAEDVCQETYVRFLIKYPYNEYPDCGTGMLKRLFTIARNFMIDTARKCKRFGLLANIDTKEYFIYTSMRSNQEKDPAKKSLESEELELTKNAINELDPREREIVMFHVYEGFKYKDIAEIMSLSETNVGVILSRAMQKLKKILSDNENK